MDSDINGLYGTCEKCGAYLKPTDVIGYYDTRHLCTKCRSTELLSDISSVILPSDSLSVLPSIKSFDMPTVSGTIDASIGGLEKGIFDWDSISKVEPRDEQIARLESKIEELESSGYEDKEEIKNLKQRLVEVEKKVPTSGDRKVTNPPFDKLCEILELWFPRRVRKYEEAYKAELAEYLSHTFLHVREEAEGGLCDIIVAKRHPIHLKINPVQSEYDILHGQIVRTLEKFRHLACLIIGIPSSDYYQDFIARVQSTTGKLKVRFFPKAR